MGTKTRRKVQQIEKNHTLKKVQVLEERLVRLQEKQLSYVDVFGVVKPYYRYHYQEATKEIRELQANIATLEAGE